MNKIMNYEYHNLKGEVMESKEFENWLSEKLKSVVINGEKFALPKFKCKNRRVYEKITEIPKRKVVTYSEIAKMSGVKYIGTYGFNEEPLSGFNFPPQARNKEETLMGFCPLGKEVKTLLKIG